MGIFESIFMEITAGTFTVNTFGVGTVIVFCEIVGNKLNIFVIKKLDYDEFYM